MLNIKKQKIVMKKLYVKPSIVFEAIETSDILETSWTKKGEDFTGKTEDDFPKTELGGGGSSEFAKSDFVFWEDEFEEESN